MARKTAETTEETTLAESNSGNQGTEEAASAVDLSDIPALVVESDVSPIAEPATGMIGDPSGKTDMRKMMTKHHLPQAYFPRQAVITCYRFPL